MNTAKRRLTAVRRRVVWWLVGFAVLFAVATPVFGDTPDPTGGGHDWLQSWSFGETNVWHTDLDYAPVSFTNIYGSPMGDGNAVVVDSSDPAWLHYNINEGGTTNNLTVDRGTVILWFAPDWSSTNVGGTGPGQWGRLIEVGSFTTNASYGWWSFFTDPDGLNLYFSSQTNSGSQTNYFSAPISWTTNYWHMLALTYSETNTALYIDGTLATNGPGLTYSPGPDVLTNGFWIGSDSNGLAQARGIFDDISSYTNVLSGDDIAAKYLYDSFYFYMNPLNMANLEQGQADSPPPAELDAITGLGNLRPGGTNINCLSDANIWLTNEFCTLVTNYTANFSFSIAGGYDGVLYDVYANAVLGPTNSQAYYWAWEGQAYHCTTYTITNLPPGDAFFVVAQYQDSDFDGLPDSYERFSSLSNPLVPSSSGDGISDLYKVQHGLPLGSVIAVPSLGSATIPSCPTP